MLVKLQSAISLLTCSCLVSVAASPSSIGFVVTSGQVQVDGAAVQGNSTLFQGDLVQAGNGTSDLMFSGGSNLLLQPQSTVKVFREYGVLLHGVAIQRGPHALVVDGLKVTSLSPQGGALVDLQDGSHLKVSAQGGAAEVRNPAGALVARLEPGKVLSFAIQAAPQATPTGMQLTLHGILRKDHAGRYGHFLLTDLATKVTYELQGSGLDDLVGAAVEVTGSTFDTKPAEGASKVLSVADIHQMPLSEMTGPATTTPPAGPPAPPTTPAPTTPSIETVPAPANAPQPAVTPPPAPPAPTEESTTPAVVPLPQNHDTAKILVIVALAAGAAVGVALGLAGGKSSTVSPE
jgi:hypothetical protein